MSSYGEHYDRNGMSRGSRPSHRSNWQHRNDVNRPWNNLYGYPNRFGDGSFLNQTYSRRYHETPWQNRHWDSHITRNEYRNDRTIESSTVSQSNRVQSCGDRFPSSRNKSRESTPMSGGKKTTGPESIPGSSGKKVSSDKHKSHTKTSPASRKGHASSIASPKRINLKKKSDREPSHKVGITGSLILKKTARRLIAPQLSTQNKIEGSEDHNCLSSPSSASRTAKPKPVSDRLKTNSQINEKLNKDSLLRMINDPRSRRSRYKLAEMVRNHAKGPSKRSVSVANLQLSEMFDDTPEPNGEIQLEKLPYEIQQEIANLTASKSPRNRNCDQTNRTNLTTETLPDGQVNTFMAPGGTSSEVEVGKLLSGFSNTEKIKRERNDLNDIDNNQGTICFNFATIEPNRSQNTANESFSNLCRVHVDRVPSTCKSWDKASSSVVHEHGITGQTEVVIKREPTSDISQCNANIDDVLLQQMSYKIEKDEQSTAPIAEAQRKATDNFLSAEPSLEVGNCVLVSKVSTECLAISAVNSISSTESCAPARPDAMICQQNSKEKDNVAMLSESAETCVSSLSSSYCSQSNKPSSSVNSPQKSSRSASIVPETSLPISLSSDLLTSQKTPTSACSEIDKSRWISNAASSTSTKIVDKMRSSAFEQTQGPGISRNVSVPNSNSQCFDEFLVRDHSTSLKKMSNPFSAPVSNHSLITQTLTPVISEDTPLFETSTSFSQSQRTTIVTEIESFSSGLPIPTPSSLSTTTGQKPKNEKNKVPRDTCSPVSERNQSNENSQVKRKGRKSSESGTMDNINKVLRLSVQEDTVRQNITAVNIKLASIQKSILKYQIQLAVLEQNKAQLVKEEESLRSERMKILQNVVSNSSGSHPVAEIESADPSPNVSSTSLLSYSNTPSMKTGKKKRQRTSFKVTPVNNISPEVNLAHSGPSANLLSDATCSLTQPERTNNASKQCTLPGNNSGQVIPTNVINTSLESSESINFPGEQQMVSSEADDVPRNEQTFNNGAQQNLSSEACIADSNGAEHNSSIISIINCRKSEAGRTREEINSTCSLSMLAAEAPLPASVSPESLSISEVANQEPLSKKKCVRPRKRKPRKGANVSPHVAAGAVIVQEKLGLSSDQLPGFCMQYIGTLTPGDDEKTIISKLASGVIDTQISELTQALASRPRIGTSLAVPIDKTSSISLSEAEQPTSEMDFSNLSNDLKSREFFMSCLSHSSDMDELVTNEPHTNLSSLPSVEPIQQCFVSLGNKIYRSNRKQGSSSGKRKCTKSKVCKEKTNNFQMNVKPKKVTKKNVVPSTSKKHLQKAKSLKSSSQNLEINVSNFANMNSGDPSYCKSTHYGETGNSTVLETENSTAQEAGNSTPQEAGNSTAREAGNSTAREAGNSTAREAGNSTAREAGNSTAREAGNSTVQEAGNSIVREAGNSTVREAGNSTVREVGNSSIQETGNNSAHETGSFAVQENCKKVEKDVGSKSNRKKKRSRISNSGVKNICVKSPMMDCTDANEAKTYTPSDLVIVDSDSLPDLDGFQWPTVDEPTANSSPPIRTPDKRKTLRTRKERNLVVTDKPVFTVDSNPENQGEKPDISTDNISTSLPKSKVGFHSQSSISNTPYPMENGLSLNRETNNNRKRSNSHSRSTKPQTDQAIARNENVKIENDIFCEEETPVVESSQFKGPDLTVSSIQVYKDQVYVCYNGCVARKFNPETSDKRCTIEYNTDSIQTQCMVVTNKGSDTYMDRVFLGGNDKTLIAFQERSGLKLDTYQFGEKITCLHDHWGHMFIGLSNGGVLVFNLKKNKPTGAFKCSNKAVCSITSATEGVRKVICVASQDCSIGVFDASSGMLLRTLDGHDGFLITIKAFNGSLYSGSSNGRILVHNINTGKMESTLCRTSGFVTCFQHVMVDNIPYLLAGSYNKFIYCYDLKAKCLKQLYYGAGYSIISSMALYDNKIISGNVEGLVEAVLFNPSQDWPCQAEGCGYVFGLQEHRNHHMKEDHHLVPCSWKTCNLWLSNENEQIVADHMTRHLIHS